MQKAVKLASASKEQSHGLCQWAEDSAPRAAPDWGTGANQNLKLNLAVTDMTSQRSPSHSEGTTGIGELVNIRLATALLGARVEGPACGAQKRPLETHTVTASPTREQWQFCGGKEGLGTTKNQKKEKEKKKI